MHSVDPILERLLRHLASKLNYDLDVGEVNLYREELTKHPIFRLADACLDAEKEFNRGTYPSLAWFKSRLGATLRENSKRA